MFAEKPPLPEATKPTPANEIAAAIQKRRDSRSSPIAVARMPMKIGVVGLGAGTIAAYGRAGDEVRFYEIDETVKRLSEEHFTFRQDTLAKADEVVLGDARLQMEREEPQVVALVCIAAEAEQPYGTGHRQ